jgi:hypothetical protein
MKASELRGEIGGTWTEEGGAWHRSAELGELPEIARQMRRAGARFATLLGYVPDGKDLVFRWYFDLDATLLGIEAVVGHGARIPSITDFYCGADWAEREARDYFDVSFSFRESTDPLVLRAEDAPGVLLEGSRP